MCGRLVVLAVVAAAGSAMAQAVTVGAVGELDNAVVKDLGLYAQEAE